jgi:hypothetical protein
MVVLLTEGHLNLPMYMCLAKHQGHFFVAHTGKARVQRIVVDMCGLYRDNLRQSSTNGPAIGLKEVTLYDSTHSFPIHPD